MKTISIVCVMLIMFTSIAYAESNWVKVHSDQNGIYFMDTVNSGVNNEKTFAIIRLKTIYHDPELVYKTSINLGESPEDLERLKKVTSSIIIAERNLIKQIDRNISIEYFNEDKSLGVIPTGDYDVSIPGVLNK